MIGEVTERKTERETQSRQETEGEKETKTKGKKGRRNRKGRGSGTEGMHGAGKTQRGETLKWKRERRGRLKGKRRVEKTARRVTKRERQKG